MSLSLKAKWRPDINALELCRQHGRDIARQWALSPLPVAEAATTPEQQDCACAAAAAAISVHRCSAACASGSMTGERRT